MQSLLDLIKFKHLQKDETSQMNGEFLGEFSKEKENA